MLDSSLISSTGRIDAHRKTVVHQAAASRAERCQAAAHTSHLEGCNRLRDARCERPASLTSIAYTRSPKTGARWCGLECTLQGVARVARVETTTEAAAHERYSRDSGNGDKVRGRQLCKTHDA